MARAPKTTATTKPAPKRAPGKPARPNGLALGRWLGDFPNLSPAEKRLVDCCARGEAWEPKPWNGERPEKATAANTIRAVLIRFLALGGDELHPAHEAGVTIIGACVDGTLELHQCQADVRLSLRSCLFAEAPILVAARLPELALVGSKLPGLRADRMKVSGGVYLRDKFEATGPVRLLGAEIGGNLECSGGNFASVEGYAVNADRIKVKGGVFFNRLFSASGEVRLLGAEIGGNLECSEGNFANAEGDALSADGINVMGGMFLRKATVDGAIRLTAARIGTLIDDHACWSAKAHILDGLHYDRIVGLTDAISRVRWLECQRADQLDSRDWSPQPWEQLVKTLREMGHPLEATKVAIAKQERMRRAGKVGGPLARALHWLYGLLAGYGYRPLNTVWAMVWACLASAFFFHLGANYGYIGPTTPLLNSPSIAAQVEAECGHRFEVDKTPWTRCPSMPPEYTTFQPLVYSLDLILPLVNLQQEADWAPVVEDPARAMPFGAFLRWLMWFEILFGWAMSLMLVAVLGKLVNKD
jgi:hypothetical protein